MKSYLMEIKLIAGLLFAVFQYTCANLDNVPIVAGDTTDSSEHYRECEEPFVSQLEDNYNDAFTQMLEFFKSTNSAVAKVNERLDRMEASLRFIKIKNYDPPCFDKDCLQQEMHETLNVWETFFNKILKISTTAKFSQIDEKLTSLEQNIATVTNQQTSLKGKATTIESVIGEINAFLMNLPVETFLKTLPRPTNGYSFGGSTFESIANALPSHSIAVKLVNYMETDLKECQLDLHYGSAQINPPTNDFSRTTQVATITPHPDGDVTATMMCGIGGTNSFLHMFFDVHGLYGRTFAAAFLSKNVPEFTIGWNSCTHSRRPTEPIEKYRCETDVTYDTTKSLLIHEGNVYAKLTFTPKETTSILTVEVFNFKL